MKTLAEQEIERVGMVLDSVAQAGSTFVVNRADHLVLTPEGPVTVHAGLYVRAIDEWWLCEGTDGSDPVSEYVRAFTAEWLSGARSAARLHAMQGFAASIGADPHELAQKVHEALGPTIPAVAKAVADMIRSTYAKAAGTGVATIGPDPGLMADKLRSKYPAKAQGKDKAPGETPPAAPDKKNGDVRH